MARMNKTSLIVEVCVDSVQSATNAMRGGANRLEVCGNLGLGGGTTPSLGLVKSIQKLVKDVPLMIMIRPRTGDFIYSEDELDVMLEDVRVFKEYGVRGMVIGILTADARVDVDRMKKLVNEIMPLEVCFHRAFDMTRDPKEALQDVASIGGITRILTSGHQPSAANALSIFQALFVRKAELVENDACQQDLVIMPGSGINTNTITSVVETLLPFGLREVHLSGGTWVDSEMLFRREGMGMGVCGEGEWGVWHTLESKVREVRDKTDTICEEIISRK